MREAGVHTSRCRPAARAGGRRSAAVRRWTNHTAGPQIDHGASRFSTAREAAPAAARSSTDPRPRDSRMTTRTRRAYVASHEQPHDDRSRSRPRPARTAAYPQQGGNGDPDRTPDEALRRRARDRRRHADGPARRGVRVPGPQRGGQDDDDPYPPGPAAPDERQRAPVRSRQPPGQPRDPRPPRQPAGRVRLRPAAHRARDRVAPRRAARHRRAGPRRRARGALPRRPRPSGRPPVARQPPEDRAHPGAVSRARAADPRRADGRAGSAHAGAVPSARRRGARARRDRLSLLARPRGGAAPVRPRRDHPRRPARRRPSTSPS